MNENDIRKYAGLMSELGLTGLEIKEDNRVVRLERMAAPSAAPALQTVSAAVSENSNVVAPSGEMVLSPMVGVFYAAPAENADPFVHVGERVQKGQTLCIVEAMKLMNEITAETDGVIHEICVSNGQVVEYGTPLFRIGG
ncbi:MAG: acetyl-CoA carboxylase biotin carboxyl carrier protein [Oscillospiraceae bacterium]|nr:acetyl-CoA carboxylase biotin carboxyl carrier protein [Oscillospiraceae bacterium]